jgi:hypothetical protein
MKKLLFLIPVILVSCQNIKDYFNAQSIIGKFHGINQAQTDSIQMEFTDSKKYVLFNIIAPSETDIGTYSVGDGYIYLSENNGKMYRIKIIDKNTLQFAWTDSYSGADTTILYRIGSEEDKSKGMVNSMHAETQNAASSKQYSKPPKILVHLRAPNTQVSVRRVIDTANLMWSDYRDDKEIDGGAIIDKSLGEDTINGLSVICIIHGVRKYCIHGSGSE